ncbi:DUF4240 domain-containing protein [Saccharothrix violaceirubra]|uniref:DUF4240 domain-containing protein n=1 Tax=Saccharothrix violaceirubra TaxID=413306 RepID=A0A7W7T761_9PSEU|nr:DUF4240 domain-containing protein [Saccharothrix violaceirubra]MBB4967837.1 hypothetical protein [Saccharothrix violaceirubra]
MDIDGFWQLVDTARADVPDADEVAARVSALLAALPREEIVAADRVFEELLASSYRTPLWAAAYVVNGGCSDDGFDYFRGWLIVQGRETFERVVADPDALADLPVVREAAEEGDEFDCEEALGIASDAYRAKTGEELPLDPDPPVLPVLEADFDFDDEEEVRERLPRLAALYYG